MADLAYYQLGCKLPNVNARQQKPHTRDLTPATWAPTLAPSLCYHRKTTYAFRRRRPNSIRFRYWGGIHGFARNTRSRRAPQRRYRPRLDEVHRHDYGLRENKFAWGRGGV